MRIIYESVLMLLTENYQNWSMLVEATACQIGAFFETPCSRPLHCVPQKVVHQTHGDNFVNS